VCVCMYNRERGDLSFADRRSVYVIRAVIFGR